MIPDDNPGASKFLTLRDVREMLTPYLEPLVLVTALAQLESGKILVLDGKKENFRIAFVPAGIGLYQVYLNENAAGYADDL